LVLRWDFSLESFSARTPWKGAVEGRARNFLPRRGLRHGVEKALQAGGVVGLAVQYGRQKLIRLQAGVLRVLQEPRHPLVEFGVDLGHIFQRHGLLGIELQHGLELPPRFDQVSLPERHASPAEPLGKGGIGLGAGRPGEGAA
jgi:hypothetical protein